jgi:endo-1,4-beta-xylanase
LKWVKQEKNMINGVDEMAKAGGQMMTGMAKYLMLMAMMAGANGEDAKNPSAGGGGANGAGGAQDAQGAQGGGNAGSPAMGLANALMNFVDKLMQLVAQQMIKSIMDQLMGGAGQGQDQAGEGAGAGGGGSGACGGGGGGGSNPSAGPSNGSSNGPSGGSQPGNWNGGAGAGNGAGNGPSGGSGGTGGPGGSSGGPGGSSGGSSGPGGSGSGGPGFNPNAGPQGPSGSDPLAPSSGGAGSSGDSLKANAAKNGMYMGTAVNNEQIKDPNFTQKAKEQFNVVTAENAMKWSEVSSKGYGEGDNFVKWAQDNDMKVRGHALIWHKQAPDEINNMSPDQLKQATGDRITDAMKHYGSSVPTWDVVNETFADGGGFRDSKFNNAMGGQNFLDHAFTTARKADPNAELVLNDYSMETKNAKSDSMYEAVKSMKERGIPIDTIGMQTHVKAGADLSSMKENIERFRALGVKVQITELDVEGGDAASKAKTTNDVMQAAKDGGASGVTFWGSNDQQSWLGAPAGLPMDNQYNLKQEVLDATNV